ncbi:MAG: thioesterase domain-containing protein [Chloroflexota bacterium]|nr:thioesterase domain-containing protein [Chloroflexota bacterium]
MTTSEFLSSLRERNVRLWLEDGQLKCDAPRGALDDAWREQLSVRKHELAALVAEAEARLGGPRSLVPLKATGDRPTLFARPGHNGDVFCYRPLAQYLDSRQPLYGVEPKGLDGGALADTVEAMAAYEVEQIRSFQAEGPYHIAGFCAGGAIAFESARQLAHAGEEVARLVLFGSPFPTVFRTGRVATQLRSVRHRVRLHGPALATGPVSDRLEYLGDRVRSRARAAQERRDPALDNRRRMEEATLAALKRYEPGFYPGRVDAFLPSAAWRHAGEGSDEWKHVARQVIEHVGPDGADGDNMLREPHVRVLGGLLNRCLRDDPGDVDRVA